jgi:mRNA-degrading endonuclease YafQ of YafQ-DinJ toxin-antitoxin module
LTKYTAVPTDTFNAELDKLSQSEQMNVLRRVGLLEANPFYPSLRTKKLKGRVRLYESSVNMDIRIIWRFEERKIILLLDTGHHNVLRKY